MTPDVSGSDVLSVLVNEGGFRWTRTSGDHALIEREHPSGLEIQTVVVPLHGRLSAETLRQIAAQAGASDAEEFREWVEQHR